MSAIVVEQLSKRYVIGHRRAADTLRDSVSQGVRGLWSRVRGVSHAPDEEFWALRDVSFAIAPGEVVGVIGRNGAGKSTLLKILSRITEPTTGRVRLRGRIASLLEVGTGFHPELTGRENIFLNGAILGMSREEIRRKFDEIVAFAEIERFLDTPVKRYSSGMYVRLAFAVAAHLEPEILIVDEVLAVGDAAFQKKCLGKMRSVSQSEGRTVLFVSHNLPSVRQLCTRTVLLNKGQLLLSGDTSSVLARYSKSIEDLGTLAVPAPTPDLLNRAYVSALAIENLAGRPFAFAHVGEPWQVRVRVIVARPIAGFVCAVGLVTSEGVGVQTVWSSPQDLAPGEYEFLYTQDQVALAADSYRVVIGLSERDQSFQQFEAARLEISGENPRIYCAAASGYGLVLNSMATKIQRLA